MNNFKLMNFNLSGCEHWQAGSLLDFNLIYSYGLPVVNSRRDLALPLKSETLTTVNQLIYQTNESQNSISQESNSSCVIFHTPENLTVKDVDTCDDASESKTSRPKEDLNKICISLNKETSIAPSKEDAPKPVIKTKKGKRGKRIPIDEKLKDHPVDIQQTYNPSTKRMNKVITCLYDNCGKKFTKTWNIIDHFKVHTGTKPFSCQCCKKTFSQNGNLTKHLKLHKKCAKYHKESGL